MLDTGAGPNFIHKDALPPDIGELKQGPLPSIADPNNRPLDMAGSVDLIVQLGRTMAKSEFLVCERLAAPMIIGADFCDKFVEAILPRKRRVELHDGTTIPIVRKVPKGPQGAPPLPTEQEFELQRGIISPKVKVSRKTVTRTGITNVCGGSFEAHRNDGD